MTKEEEKYTTLDIEQCKWWVNTLFGIAKEKACNSHNFDDGEEIQAAQDKIIKALEQQPYEDCVGVDEVVCGFTVQRIVEITKAYEEKKKAVEEIQVGDEVVCNCPNKQRVIITSKYDGWVTFMRKDGACYSRAEMGMKKTGRHFEEISQLLDKLRGEE